MLVNTKHTRNILSIAALSLLITFLAASCVSKGNKVVQNPPGYDLDKPIEYSMPDILQEVSGIAFHKGDNSFVYAQQDEDGKLFKLPLGTKDETKTKFAGKGDYEDVSIINDWVLLLKSNGDVFSFPLSEKIFCGVARCFSSRKLKKRSKRSQSLGSKRKVESKQLSKSPILKKSRTLFVTSREKISRSLRRICQFITGSNL